jgi:DNA recombination protein RmuC
MNNISLLIPLTISLLTLITVIVYYTNKKKKISNSFRDLELKYTETLTLLNQNKEHLDQLNYNYTLLQTKEQNITQQNALLIHKNETLTTTIENQKKEFEDLQQQSLWQFEKIADRIFEDKNNKFNQIQQDKLNLLLTPLKEDIVNFKTTIDKTHLEETKQRSQLDERIKNLLHHTNSISNEANNLASALKGKSQLRGYWGELILERILEQSGLQKGREYFTQSSFKDEYGNNLRPDVTIQLPDNRIIFIDSKVSLIDFEQYSAAQSIEEQSKFLKQHISSTLTHINQLSKKRYDDQEQSIDFTFLFIPIEAAYLSIIEADNSIWTKAYDKRIVIV